MFERFTESARRALFFARYEVSQLGATAIEPDHVLLGLIRERQGLVERILTLSQVSPEELRREIESRAVFREKISTSVEIPFSTEVQHALLFAAEEADRLTHDYIGTEHMLLGLLRAEGSVAASLLTSHGLRLVDVRNSIVTLLAEPPSALPASTRADVLEYIEHIRQLVVQLAGMSRDTSEAHVLSERIHGALEALKRLAQ